MSRKRRASGEAPHKDNEVDQRDPEADRYVRRHMRIGWWSLLVFVTLGLMLESMHGFKVQWYVSADNSTRRLMFTLAHAHGTLVSIVHLVFAAAIRVLGPAFHRFRRPSSWCLLLAGMLLPGGFFAGGAVIYEGDPGLGILLVPVGGSLLVLATLLTALSVESKRWSGHDED